MRAWRFVSERGAVPDEQTLATARRSVGFRHLHVEPDTSTVTFGRPGMSLDLGAAGKGYAVDVAMDVLREQGVTQALLHGGRQYGHVMDPRAGVPSSTAQAAAVTGPGSFECDALSTAALVHGRGWLPTLRERFPAYDGDLAQRSRVPPARLAGRFRIRARG